MFTDFPSCCSGLISVPEVIFEGAAPFGNIGCGVLGDGRADESVVNLSVDK